MWRVWRQNKGETSCCLWPSFPKNQKGRVTITVMFTGFPLRVQQIRCPDGDLEMSGVGFVLAFSRRIPIVLFVKSMETDSLWSLNLHTFISDFPDYV